MWAGKCGAAMMKDSKEACDLKGKDHKCDCKDKKKCTLETKEKQKLVTWKRYEKVLVELVNVDLIWKWKWKMRWRIHQKLNKFI